MKKGFAFSARDKKRRYKQGLSFTVLALFLALVVSIELELMDIKYILLLSCCILALIVRLIMMEHKRL